ncbi:MAG: DPP IV N-terminal domain-containing protein [bacterium]
MRAAIYSCLILCLVIFCYSESNAQWEKEVGKLAFENVMLPRPAGPGKVAFFRADTKIPGNPIELYVAEIATGDETRVLPGYNFREAANVTAAFSPDGKQMIVPQKQNGSWELFLYEGGSRTGKAISNLAPFRVELTENEAEGLSISPDQQLSIDELSWSPSGKRVIFTLNRFAKSAVWWHDLVTGESRQATEDRVGYTATFFPDDENICYVAMTKKGEIRADEDVLKRSIITGEITPLCNSESHEFAAAVSPDGKYVLFAKRVNDINNIYVKNIASGETRQMTFGGQGQSCNLACWSADGKAIYIQAAGFLAAPALFVRDFTPF